MRYGRQGFTVVELLVVVSILSVLLAILMPSLGQARELAKRAVCVTQLHHVHLATADYGQANDDAVPPRYWAWSHYHVGNDYTDGGPQSAMGFLLLVNGRYVDDARVLFCPSDPYFDIEHHWPEGDRGGTRNWLAYCCSYAQREEALDDHFRLTVVPPSYAYTSDWFTTAIPALPYAVHRDGWNVGYFDGSAEWIRRTPGIWSGITWSHDFTGQAVTWWKFDR